nr:hypothetical protein [Tanacetum cinerariifolium]
ARDALRSTNGDNSHNSGTGVGRTERATCECTYTDFLKCQPLPFKAPKELLVFRSGVKEWSLSFTSATAPLKTKGLPNMIYGSVVASKPKTMQEAIEIATKLMDKKILTFSERETASKRKFENTSRPTRNQQ